ncbi:MULTISPECIES: hypothetical protein [unclassified Streptomyces]
MPDSLDDLDDTPDELPHPGQDTDEDEDGSPTASFTGVRAV